MVSPGIGYNNFLMIVLQISTMSFRSPAGTEQKGLPRLLHNRFFVIFILCMLIYNINLHPIPSYDTLPARLLPWNIYENHNLNLDSFTGSATGNILSVAVEENGQYLSPFPIVTPILITPLIAVPYIFLKLRGIPVSVDNPTFILISLIAEKVIASLITSLSVCILYWILSRLVSERIALACSLIYAFGTSTWVISSQALWQHGMVELLLCCMIATILKISDDEGGIFQKRNQYLCLGVLSALYALSRPPDMVYLIPVFFFVLAAKDGWKIIRYLAGLCLTAAPFVLYNVVYFGSLFGGYKANAATLQISQSILPAFAAYLISPNRGLFFFSPILLFSLLGMWLCLKNTVVIKPDVRRIFILFALLVPVNILVYCSFPAWWGGESFGYRYLVDSLPVLAIFLAIAAEYLWRSRSSVLSGIKIAFVLCVIWSVLVQALGAFYYYYDWDMKNSRHESVNTDPSRVWNISDLQIFYGVSLNPNPYALFMQKLHENRSSSFYKAPAP